TRIEISVLAAPRLGQKREEREDHGYVVLVRGQQKCIERAQRGFINLAGRRHVFLPTGPDSSSDHVDAGFFHRAEIFVPDERVRLEEKATMLIGSHVSRAGDRKDRAVAIEVVFVDREWLAASEQRRVVNPETVYVSEMRRIETRLCGNDVETRPKL